MNLRTLSKADVARLDQVELYTIIYIPAGSGSLQIDGGNYKFSGPIILFLAPFQKINIEIPKKITVSLLEFHGDFYCIEFHKAEVACNGLLFNNVFLYPHIKLSDEEAFQIEELFSKINNEMKAYSVPDRSVLTAYLQLILAIASRMKKNKLQEDSFVINYDKRIDEFKKLVDEKFLEMHKPSDYAKILKISSNDLTKRCRKVFGKTPSSLINEKLILEAKKKLHLTRQSVKEVAFELNFKDEHYFSRYFKKSVGISPLKFRQKVGISVVADLSMD